MCGIAGFVDPSQKSEAALLKTAQAMADRMRYRGPDAGAAWADAEAGFATGHRRLSIVDLTPTGAQPMISGCGRFVLSYNGEVYNAAELRAQLGPQTSFRGSSDTEVILEACAKWGVVQTAKQLIGMFAFALWDRKERTLWLVRDRLGIKPLYWLKLGNAFLFASEIKGLREHKGWTPEIDRNAIAIFLRLGYIPAPHSIYRGVQKLQPGTILKFDQSARVEIESFWSLQDVVEEARRNPFRGSDDEAIEALTRLLSDAVKRRMIADVPLGAFLSGGIDSSTVVALMQAQSTRPIRTFSIGFHESTYNEAHYAKTIAQHLGTDHEELYVTSAVARDVIPSLPEMYDEPFSDSSQIPTFLVSQLARRHVTVALSGDGGDELFCGYGRYFHARTILRGSLAVPRPIRHFAADALKALPSRQIDALAQAIIPRGQSLRLGQRITRVADLLRTDEDKIYLSLLSLWHDPENIVLDAREPVTVLGSHEARAIVPDFTDRMQYLDTLTYLPDDILTKVDRASMAVSLEARVPILDHRVVQFAWRLPQHMRIRDGNGKWILRRVLERFVPRELFERPKMGFGVPIGDWLREPLRPWAESLLSEKALTDRGFNPAPIRSRWKAHLETNENWQYPLWAILSLQAWLAQNA